MTGDYLWMTLIAASLGGVLALDTVAAGQFFLSCPLVSCTLLGWVLGNPLLGTMIGIVLTLPWLGTLPVGGYTPPDSSTAALAITLGAILAVNTHPQISPMATAVIALLPAPIIATIAGFWDHFIYHRNETSVVKAEAQLGAGNIYAPARATLKGLARFYAKGFLLIAVGGWLVFGLVELVYALLGDVSLYLSWVYYAWLGLGMGIVISSFRGWKVPLGIAGGLAVGAGWVLATGCALW
jgi:mannose/fructose/N-acetylgalactosamine-specific phosphotransferase system component IIC